MDLEEICANGLKTKNSHFPIVLRTEEELQTIQHTSRKRHSAYWNGDPFIICLISIDKHSHSECEDKHPNQHRLSSKSCLFRPYFWYNCVWACTVTPWILIMYEPEGQQLLTLSWTVIESSTSTAHQTAGKQRGRKKERRGGGVF